MHGSFVSVHLVYLTRVGLGGSLTHNNNNITETVYAICSYFYLKQYLIQLDSTIFHMLLELWYITRNEYVLLHPTIVDIKM